MNWNSYSKIVANKWCSVGVIVALIAFSYQTTFAQCAIPPVGCNGTNLANSGIGSNNSFSTLEYDNYVSSFHTTVVRTGNGSFVTWGEQADNDGSTSLLVPLTINSTNFPALTGTPLKAGLGSNTINAFQGVVLTTTGLFAWGVEGIVLDPSITSSTTFQKITVGGNANGLPTGVTPALVKMMYVGYQTIAITTCGGEVWVLSQVANERGVGGAGSNTAWSRVTTTAVGNPALSNIVACRGAGNALMALKSDGTLWVWGSNIYIGNGTAVVANQTRAIQMTSPVGITPKMIQVNYAGTSTRHSFYVLATNGNLYALGDNTVRQLGDWTTTDRTSWVQPRYTSAAGPVMNDISWISSNEHDNFGIAGINVIRGDSLIYAFGDNKRNTLGVFETDTGVSVDQPRNPTIPASIPATYRFLQVETGGHTSMVVEKCNLNFGYVGHRVNGSMGNGSAANFFEAKYTFNTAAVQVCGSETATRIRIKAPSTFPSPNGNQCKDGVIVIEGAPGGGTLTLLSGPASLSNDTLRFNGVGTALVKYKITNICGRTDSVIVPYIGEECLDTVDGDNVPNYVDYDNDNDGILDTVECPLVDRLTNGSFSSGSSNWTLGTGWSVVAGRAENTADVPLGVARVLSQSVTNIRVPNVRVELKFDIHSQNQGGSLVGTIGFANLEIRLGGVKYLVAQNDTSMIGKITAFNGAIVNVDTFIVDNNLTNYTRVTVLIPYTASNTALLEIIDSVITGGDDFQIDNISLASSLCDTDGDGIVDYMDYDSDNDGCSDADEAYSNLLADGNDNPYGVYGTGIPSYYGGTSNINGLVIAAGVDGTGKLYTSTPVKTLVGARYTFQQRITTFATDIKSKAAIVGGSAFFPATIKATAGFTNPATQIGSTTSNILNYSWQVSTNGGLTWTTITAAGTMPKYSGFTGSDTIGAAIGLTVSNIPYGANHWKYRIYITHESNLCGAASSGDSADLTVYKAESDILIVNVNKPATGNVNTNDSVPVGTIYGPVTPNAGNPSACLPVMAANGTYSFTCATKGIYYYDVTICPPLSTCIKTQLKITVKDSSIISPPTANTDKIETNKGLPWAINVLANDACNNGPGCTLTNLTVVRQPSNGSAVVVGSDSVRFTPFAGFEGLDTIIYQVCDNQVPAPMCDTAFIFVTVYPPRPNYTVAVEDYKVIKGTATLNGNVLANDYDVEGNTQSVTPQNIVNANYTLTINANGTYSFKANPGFTGTISTAYKVCDNGTPVACDTATLFILVLPEDFNTDPDFLVTNINVPSSGNVKTNDVIPGGTTYGTPVAQAGNPSACTPVMAANGSYTFLCSTPGEYNFSVPVCPPWIAVNCPRELLTITVLDPRIEILPPTANPDKLKTVSGVAKAVNVRSNDKCNNGSSCSLGVPSIVTQPRNGTATVNGSGNVVVTPNPGFVGKDTLLYSVCDNQSPTPKCDSEYVFITVVPPFAPNSTEANDDFNATKGTTPATGNVLDNDIDPEGNVQTVTAQNIGNANGTFVLNTNGTYTFTASNTFSGPVSYPYVVCDNGIPSACDTATIQILVNPSDFDTDPDFMVTTINTSTLGNVNTNDTVPAGTAYGTPTALPGNPSACTPLMNPNGSYTFLCAVPGEYNYSVPVCPPGVFVNCPKEYLTITVLDPKVPSHPPVANPDVLVTFRGTPRTLNIIANDACNNGPTCTLSNPTIVKQPANGNVVVNVNGTITFTPNPGFEGIDTILYSVCDNQTPTPKCDSEYVFVTVKPIGSPNSTNANDDYNLAKYKKIVSGNVLLNDFDIEGNTQSVTPQNIVNANGTFVLLANGDYTYTPSGTARGPIDFVYTVCDNGIPSACDKATLHMLVITPDCITTNRHLKHRIK